MITDGRNMQGCSAAPEVVTNETLTERGTRLMWVDNRRLGRDY